MSTVVVTGAAGSLGSRVLEQLLARPDVQRTVAVDLVPVAAKNPRLDTRVVDLAVAGGPVDSELERVMQGADAVLHLAWSLPDGKGATPADLEVAAAANQRSLSRVLRASARAGVASVVYVSSATVYGAWADNKIPLTEDANLRPNPEFSFAVSKAESERILADWTETNPSVAVSVLRPAVTVGADGRPIYQALGITRAPRLGDEGRPVQYLHLDDLASAVVLAWEVRLRGVFNVAPDSGIPEEQARALAGGVAKVSVPDRLAARLASLGWRLWRQGVPLEAQAYATHPWVVAPDRLKAAGWVPGYSSEEALVATDDRLHWDDLPPGRRQNLNLVVVVLVSTMLGATVAGVIAALVRRRRSTR